MNFRALRTGSVLVRTTCFGDHLGARGLHLGAFSTSIRHIRQAACNVSPG